jgi:hypothetical protein
MNRLEIQEYQAAVRTVALLSSILLQHDIPELLAAIEHADAVGPLVDPTLWRNNHKKMAEDREILQAALPMYALGSRLANLREGSYRSGDIKASARALLQDSARNGRVP